MAKLVAEQSPARVALSSAASAPAERVAGDELDEQDPTLAAKATLNAAMDADRRHDYQQALTLYQRGIGELLQVRAASRDTTTKAWCESQAARHLERAEKLKEYEKARARETSDAGDVLLSRADEAWHDNRFAEALVLYERAREALRADPTHTAEQLVHASTRIEMLVERENSGGSEFATPVPLGLRPGEKYVDPVQAPSKMDRFKHKAATLKKKVAQKMDDDPW